jgi:hypothetical protein
MSNMGGCVSCFGRSFAAVTRAMAKAAGAKLRALAGTPHHNWPARARVCQTCHLLVVRDGTQYCGRPFLRLPLRDPAADGCGCPVMEKAKSQAEHCPLNARQEAAVADSASVAGCDCKWCKAA